MICVYHTYPNNSSKVDDLSRTTHDTPCGTQRCRHVTTHGASARGTPSCSQSRSATCPSPRSLQSTVFWAFASSSKFSNRAVERYLPRDQTRRVGGGGAAGSPHMEYKTPYHDTTWLRSLSITESPGGLVYITPCPTTGAASRRRNGKRKVQQGTVKTGNADVPPSLPPKTFGGGDKRSETKGTNTRVRRA